MSFFEYKDFIEENDLVLAYIGRNSIKPIKITPGAQLNTRYGNFEHERMIGMKYGEQMAGAKGYGFIYLLYPTPELWTLSLPHRTQIVYTADSSYIIQRMDVRNGSRVIEAGTGSGSFTHSFARTVGEDGRVFSYEFHEPRYLEAKKEFQEHALINTCITLRDVCEDGFDIMNIPETFKKDGGISADAIFLDLPSPWTAIPHIDKVATKESQTRICCFSPCIEQVDKTIRALQENNWTCIETVEVAGRRWEARKEMVRDIGQVITRLRDIQARKSQGIEARRMAVLKDEQTDTIDEQPVDSEPAKKFQNIGKGFNPFGKGQRIKEGDKNYSWMNVSKIESEVKSHTSYLTFACKIPL